MKMAQWLFEILSGVCLIVLHLVWAIPFFSWEMAVIVLYGVLDRTAARISEKLQREESRTEGGTIPCK